MWTESLWTVLPSNAAATQPIARTSDSASSAEPTQVTEIRKLQVPDLEQYRPNSYRSEHFWQLWKAVDRMRRLPTHHKHHLKASVADKAIVFLNTIHREYSADLPLLLPEDDDHLVLTWDQDPVKSFFNISEDEQDLMTLHKRNRVSCDVELPNDFPQAVNDVIQLLAFPSRAKSSSTDD